MHTCLDLVDDLTSGVVRLPSLSGPLGCSMESSQSEMGLPELERIADLLEDLQGSS
jgi:hypothetical protein